MPLLNSLPRSEEEDEEGFFVQLDNEILSMTCYANGYYTRTNYLGQSKCHDDV